MVDATRALLDELMGKERNLAPEERTGKGISYKDAKICKYALAGLCPYGLFKNTKSDLGLCKYEVHDDDPEFEPAKQEWDQLPEEKKERYGYRQEMIGLLQQLVKDMDRKIERQKDRAAKESENRVPNPTEQAQLDELKSQTKDASKKSEDCAEAGNIDDSMTFANQAEQLKKQHDELYKQFTTPERTMQVCEVCGVFINSTDSDQRKADHLAGKQYQGWLQIRARLKEEVKADDEKRAARNTSKTEPRNGESERNRGRDREKDRDRDSRRERERDRDSRRDRERSSRRRSRSREHDRHRRDSDRDRSDRHHDRRRSRSRDKYRGSEIPPPDSLYGKSSNQRARERYF